MPRPGPPELTQWARGIVPLGIGMTRLDEAEALIASLSDDPDLNAGDWKHAGGTPAGGYFYAGQAVLVAVPRPGYVQREPDARRSLEEFIRIAKSAGHPHAVIVLVDRVASQDSASRRVWSNATDGGLRSSLALVGSTPLGRAIGSFFIGLSRPPVPTKMFSTFADALAWSGEQAQQAGERFESE